MEKEYHKYLLRIPNPLKEDLVKEATKEKRSLGNYIINVLSLHIDSLDDVSSIQNKK